MRTQGYGTALSVCISHYGGDYGNPELTKKDGYYQYVPSCFDTVAARNYGYAEKAQEPFATYLAGEKEQVINTRKCIEDFFRKSK